MREGRAAAAEKGSGRQQVRAWPLPVRERKQRESKTIRQLFVHIMYCAVINIIVRIQILNIKFTVHRRK